VFPAARCKDNTAATVGGNFLTVRGVGEAACGVGTICAPAVSAAGLSKWNMVTLLKL
jgi:hypothetical protein